MASGAWRGSRLAAQPVKPAAPGVERARDGRGRAGREARLRRDASRDAWRLVAARLRPVGAAGAPADVESSFADQEVVARAAAQQIVAAASLDQVVAAEPDDHVAAFGADEMIRARGADDRREVAAAAEIGQRVEGRVFMSGVLACLNKKTACEGARFRKAMESA